MPNAEFLAELAAIEAVAASAVRQEVENLIVQVLRAICEGNSVVLDTGRSTASWVTSSNAPVYYIAADITETSRLNAAQAVERSLRTIDNLADYNLGDPIYIANGNDYVIELEFAGKSRKAPSGFVQLAMAGFPDVQYRLIVE